MSDIWSKYDYVFGCDPGFVTTGFAVLNKDGAVENTFIKTDAEDCREKRMWDVKLKMDCIHLDHFEQPDGGKGVLFCIEENHVSGGRSAQTMLQQRELIGVLSLSAFEMGYDVTRVTATQCKKALTGNGRAEKEGMVDVAGRYPGWFAWPYKYQQEACADALGAALAGIEKVVKG